MCQLKSALVLKDSVFMPDYDSYEQMISELKLNDKTKEPDFVRVEICPKRSVFEHPNTWKFNVDQDLLPEWWSAKFAEKITREELNKWWNIHVIVDKKIDVIGKGVYYVGGKSVIENVRDFAVIENVRDFAVIKNVRDFAVIKNVRDSAVIENVRDFAVIENVRDFAVIKNVRDFAVIKNVRDSAVIENVEESAVIWFVRGSAAIENVRDSAVIKSVEDSAVIKSVKDSAVIENVEDFAVIENVRDSAVIKNVRDSAVIENVWNSAIKIQKLSDNAIYIVRYTNEPQIFVANKKITMNIHKENQ